VASSQLAAIQSHSLNQHQSAPWEPSNSLSSSKSITRNQINFTHQLTHAATPCGWLQFAGAVAYAAVNELVLQPQEYKVLVRRVVVGL
jgi:hypothetical protein